MIIKKTEMHKCCQRGRQWGALTHWWWDCGSGSLIYFPELVEAGTIGHENILRRELSKCKVCYYLL